MSSISKLSKKRASKGIISILAGAVMPFVGNAQSTLYPVIIDEDSVPTRELSPGKEYQWHMRLKKSNSNKKIYAVVWDALYPKNGSVTVNPIQPTEHYLFDEEYDSNTKDFFCLDSSGCFGMDTEFNNNFVSLTSAGRATAPVKGIDGKMRFPGIKEGDGIVGVYGLSVSKDAPLSQSLFGAQDKDNVQERATGLNSDGSSDFVNVQNIPYAFVPEPRTKPLIMSHRNKEGTLVYTTGLSSPDGSRTGLPVRIQRSLDLQNWQTLVPGKDNITLTYTNRITGSFEVLDSNNLPTTFFRSDSVVSPETASQANKP